MWDSKNAREYMSFPEAKNAPTCIKLDILKIEYYVYFQVELNITNVEFHLNFS